MISAFLSSRRGEAVAAGVLALVMLAQLALGAPALSPTHDELANAPAGVAWLTQGRSSDFTHPPLPRLVVAAALLSAGARPADSPEALAALDAWVWKVYGREFVFHNRGLGSAALVFVARLPIMFVAVALALIVWRVARRRHGVAGGLVAMAACSFSPTLLGHGRLCTPDVPAAFTTFIAAIALARAFERRTWRAEAWAGAALGLALATKYSAVTLIPAAALLSLATWALGSAKAGFVRAVARPLAIMLLVAAVLVWATFAFEVARPIDDPMIRDNPMAAAVVARADARLASFGVSANTLLHLPLPAYSFWKGLGTQVAHNFLQDEWMHDSFQYLDGRYSQTGWFAYYPLAFLWKTEGALLLALAWLVPLTWKRVRAARVVSGSWRQAAGGLDVETWTFLIVASVFAASCLTSTINVGHRYLLPLFPFLFVAVGSLARRGVSLTLRGVALRAYVLAALGLGLAVPSLLANPDHLSYFNVLGGGAANGWRRLADSNVDWGQDLWRLRRVLDRAWDEPYHLDVFTSARTDLDYGLERARPLPVEPERLARVSGLAIVSVNRLLFKLPRETTPRRAWLWSAEPFAKIGDSLFLYWMDGGRAVAPPASVRRRFQAASSAGVKVVLSPA